jgi:hypothetical protein
MGALPKNKITRAERGKRRRGNTPKLKKDANQAVPMHKRSLVSRVLRLFTDGPAAQNATKTDKAASAKSSKASKSSASANAKAAMSATAAQSARDAKVRQPVKVKAGPQKTVSSKGK